MGPQESPHGPRRCGWAEGTEGQLPPGHGLCLSCSLQCGAAFQEDDVIVLNGTKEDADTLRSRMEERRLRARVGKVRVSYPSLLLLSLPCMATGDWQGLRPLQPGRAWARDSPAWICRTLAVG